MKRFTTALCSIAFAISGICLAVQESNQLSMPGNMTAVASPTIPTLNLENMRLPKDLQLDLVKHNGTYRDSVVKHDTVYVEKTTPKRAKARVRVKHKTLYVPVLYIATPKDTGSSEDSTEITYRVHKVENISDLKIN